MKKVKLDFTYFKYSKILLHSPAENLKCISRYGKKLMRSVGELKCHVAGVRVHLNVIVCLTKDT